MDNGQWTMDNGQWTMDNGQWTMVNGQWSMDNGQWSMDNGQWLPEEAEFHINYKELKAALFALQSFETQLVGKHVRILVHNTTAVSCIRHKGTSHSDTCNDTA